MASGRRFLGYLPKFVGRPWHEVSRDIDDVLRKLWESEADGIPAGFNSTTPEALVPDSTGDAGTLNSGWAAADNDHPIDTAVAVDLGAANAEGASSNFSRSDHIHAYPDHGLLPGLQDNDHLLYQRKHGFDVTSAGIPYAEVRYEATGARVVGVRAPGGFPNSRLVFWIDGVRYSLAGEQTVTHTIAAGKHYVYFDASGVLQVSVSPWSILNRTVTPVAIVFYDAAGAKGVCFYECHTADRWLEGHYNLHFSRGTQIISGLGLNGYTLNTDSDAAVTLGVDLGVIADEDIKFSISALSDGGFYAIFTRTGASGDWVWTTTDTFPFKSGTTYPQWNNPNGGGAGIWGMTELVGTGLGEWVNYYLFAVPSIDVATQLILVPGQAKFSSLSAAQLEGLSGIKWGTMPFEEIAPIARLTFHARSTYAGTHKTQLQGVALLASSVPVTSVTSSPVNIYHEKTGVFVSPAGASDVTVWSAPYPCAVVAVKGYRVGGTGATINARINTTTEHLSADLSLTSADTWMDGGAITSGTYATGDSLELRLKSVAGGPTAITIQVELRRI